MTEQEKLQCDIKVLNNQINQLQIKKFESEQELANLRSISFESTLPKLKGLIDELKELAAVNIEIIFHGIKLQFTIDILYHGYDDEILRLEYCVVDPHDTLSTFERYLIELGGFDWNEAYWSHDFDKLLNENVHFQMIGAKEAEINKLSNGVENYTKTSNVAKILGIE